MSKETEKAEWRRRQAIKPPAPRVLHASKRFEFVKTDTLPKLVFSPGRTLMGPEAIERRLAARAARQQVRDQKMIEQANATIDKMKSVADKALASLTVQAEVDALD